VEAAAVVEKCRDFGGGLIRSQDDRISVAEIVSKVIIQGWF